MRSELAALPQGVGFSFPPPVIPGIGTSGAVTFVLEDRVSRDVKFLADNTDRFIAAAKKRPELTGLSTTLLADVPQVYVNVDRFGNTSAASIAIALDEAVKTGRLKPGMVVMLCAFEGPPRIVRLHGTGEVLTPDDARFDDNGLEDDVSQSRVPQG